MIESAESKRVQRALGERIKYIRKLKGLRMIDLMSSSGYLDAQWRNYEAGAGLTFATLLTITSALGVSIGYLLDGLTNWPDVSVDEIEKQHDAQHAEVLGGKPRKKAAKQVLKRA